MKLQGTMPRLVGDKKSGSVAMKLTRAHLWSKSHFYTIYSLPKSEALDQKWARISFMVPGPAVMYCGTQRVISLFCIELLFYDNFILFFPLLVQECSSHWNRAQPKSLQSAYLTRGREYSLILRNILSMRFQIYHWKFSSNIYKATMPWLYVSPCV